MDRMATDVGGTFTDLVFHDETTDQLTVIKTLTTPANPADGVLDALSQSKVDAADVASFVHGGTTVINALTERRGVRTALVTTAGFRDVLEIGRGNRPDMYDLRFASPVPFVARRHRFEVRERLNFNGAVIDPLSTDDLETVAKRCDEDAIQSIAIVFLHAYANPGHEQVAAEFFRARLPGVSVTASHEITREWREYERSNTAVLNAYVKPIITDYFADLAGALESRGIAKPYYAMQSNGGTTDFEWASDHPLTLVESGPAAGVNGAALIGRTLGENDIISLDIGGTTAKCSLIEGAEPKVHTAYAIERSRTRPGYPLQIPTVDIVEIGAGGGSIAGIDTAGSLRVGPRSAGADPGPACYDRGGHAPTVTDAKLLTGVLDPTRFAGGSLPLSVAAAETAMATIADGLGCGIEEAAVAVIRVAEANMISALKLISVQRGHDPRGFALIVSGGGGPMHGAYLGRELAVKKVLVPPHSGLFSALGMLSTLPRYDLARTDLQRLSTLSIADIEAVFADMEAEARRYFQTFARNRAVPEPVFTHMVDMRYDGQEHTVTFPLDPSAATTNSVSADFHAAHEKAYTFSLTDTEAEVVCYRLKSELPIQTPRPTRVDGGGQPGDALIGRRVVNFAEDGKHETPVYRRSDLGAGSDMAGPCLIEELSSTTMVLPGQRVAVDDYGVLHIA